MQGRVLVGCDKALRIYDLGKKKLLHKSANKRFGSWIQVDRGRGRGTEREREREKREERRESVCVKESHRSLEGGGGEDRQGRVR